MMRLAAITLALLLAGCAAPIHAHSPRPPHPAPLAHRTPAPPMVVQPCPVPDPPSDAALAAAPGLVGRYELLTAYAASVAAAKRACR